MHWVIQKNLFKPVNYNLLIEALSTLDISYTPVYIPTGSFDLEPEVSDKKNVYVCGAIKLKKISENLGWFPGSFLNENFAFDKWLEELKDELLNYDALLGKMSSIETSHMEKFFIRPLEDNKAFDGSVVDNEMLFSMKNDRSKPYLENLEVIVSPIKNIYREYRLFYVKNQYVTGSLYKVAGRPYASSDVENSVIQYADSIVKKWVPSESFVIDISLNESGYKVIEFNNINSSSFYAANMSKYVQAIQDAYSEA